MSEMTKTPEISDGVLDRLLKAQKADPSDHGDGGGKCHAGVSKKTVKSELCAVEIDISCDQTGSFEPQRVKKAQTTMHAFDKKIILIFARGFDYLAAILHLLMRKRLSWHLSITFETALCIEVAEGAIICYGKPKTRFTSNRRPKPRQHKLGGSLPLNQSQL